MHNNIMAAGSKDRPPMLGPGRYSQWHSRFLRYLDTKSNGEYLRKCIFEGLGYNDVPPPYTGNFMPPKPDLSFSSFEEFTSEPIVIKPIVEKREAKASEAKPKAVRCENSYFQAFDFGRGCP
ncbi:hypothetical protein Tco_0040874 [Tanacetum coccineum]